MIRIAVSFAIDPPVPKNTWLSGPGARVASFAASSAAGGVVMWPKDE